MASTKLHIEGSTGRPTAIKHYLDLIDRRDFDSVDAVMDAAFHEFGFPDPEEYDRDLINTKNMATTLAKLGLVYDDDRQQLTELGQDLVEVIIYNEELFYELLHFIYATTYQRDPSPNRAISWSYYQICASLCSKAPVSFSNARQEVVENVMQEADRMTAHSFDNHGPVSERSLNSYRHFIRHLDPPVLEDGEFNVRSFVEKQLVLAAIDHLYRTDTVVDTVDYGDQLQLEGIVSDALCTICLLDEADLNDVVEHAASMDSRLSVEADYSLHVRLTEPVELHELA